MRRIITNIFPLKSKTMINEDEYDMIDNGICNYDNLFQPGSSGGMSQVDVSLSQTRIDLDNVVNGTIMITGTFYKQALPSFLMKVTSCCGICKATHYQCAVKF